MIHALQILTRSREAALTIGLVGLATVATALVFQHGFGYLPCKLCLQQRWPYYAGVPLAFALAVAAPPKLRRAGLVLLGLIFLIGAALALYHAGVEWGFWVGPSDCGGAPPPVASGVGDLMKQLQTVRVVSCTEAAFRVLGLSMAGWNALISLGLGLLALLAARRDA